MQKLMLDITYIFSLKVNFPEEVCMCNMKLKVQYVLLAAACTLALLVATLPLHAEETKKPEKSGTEQKGSLSAQEPEGIVAKAVYYKNSYNGKKTSSGAIYNPKKLTAAHPSIPLGTRVKIINLANSRSVVVTVNDRCRNHGYEIIDLSREAARQLDFLRIGTARVRIIPLQE
jgi:rare lipoprotein A